MSLSQLSLEPEGSSRVLPGWARVLIGLAVIGVMFWKLPMMEILTIFFYLFLARAFVSLTPDNIVAIQLTNRSIADIGLIALLPLAALLATPRQFASRVARATGSHPRPGNPALVAANAAVPLALCPTPLANVGGSAPIGTPNRTADTGVKLYAGTCAIPMYTSSTTTATTTYGAAVIEAR